MWLRKKKGDTIAAPFLKFIDIHVGERKLARPV